LALPAHGVLSSHAGAGISNKGGFMWESDEGKNVSYWQTSQDAPATGSLTESIETDACIIGGGIAGLTTAYLLTRAGKKVVVIDDGTIGGGETARTTAHLTYALDDRIYRIAKWHGDDKARLALESHSRAIDQIEAIVSAEKIDCDFSRLDGYLFEAEESDDDLDEELELAHSLGFDQIQMVEKAPIKDFDTGRALKFPNQGQFHILKYLAGLARVIEQNGGRLFSKTRAVQWTGENSPSVKTSDNRTITAGSIVLATNYPIQSKMFGKLPAYRTYAIGVRVPKGSVEKVLLWDTGDPYHYIRIQEESDHDVLIVGGEDHRTGQENDGDERFQNLWKWTAERFASAEEVIHRWSGQCFETHDGLAFIGRFSDDEPNVYLITGDSGMGMTHGTIGGMIVSDLILGRTNPWTEVYEPSRVETQSIIEAVPEVIKSAAHYVDWITGGDVSAVDEIKNGEGAIIRDGTSKIAVYRDENGKLHQRSAVCTHMGCIVGFNSAEKTWDCPCHGSRFGVDGHVINTPAMSPLERIEEDA
jgi:glycine/D-amino acid oxidase-like deaminating enzyme/nitrite reductase/ring-hydroxylating ferredoxin subunit